MRRSQSFYIGPTRSCAILIRYVGYRDQANAVSVDGVPVYSGDYPDYVDY